MEAEALGVITHQAVKRTQAFEVNATDLSVGETAGAVREILEGRIEGYEPGRIDWSEVILGWY